MEKQGPELLALQLEEIMEQVWKLTGMVAEILHGVQVYPEKYEHKVINLEEIF